MTYILYHHDARHISDLLEPESVDLVITSPPYFSLRSYRDGGEHFREQVGSEPTPGEFVDALIECTRDWLRVLKPTGSLFVNLGDKYAGSGGHNNNGIGSSTLVGTPSIRDRSAQPATRRNAPDRYNQASDGIRDKSLMGLPWRYAIRCIDELGLILRAEVIWSKPNGLPESVTDRVRRSHEQFFHFTREGRYFAAIDEVREATDDIGRKDKTVRAGPLVGNHGSMGHDGAGMRMAEVYNNPLGKAPGSVWAIKEDLWDHVLSGPMHFCPRCGRDLRAGNGAATTIRRATRDNGSPTSATDGPPDSSTNCSSPPSLTGSPSTTSAATVAASTPPTSSRSPSRRTSGDETQPTGAPHASTGTSGPRPTPMSESEDRVNVACVCEIAPVPTGLGSTWTVPSEPLKVPAYRIVQNGVHVAYPWTLAEAWTTMRRLGVANGRPSLRTLPDHFAAFPSELVRRIVLGWSPSGYCTVCDEPRRAVVEQTNEAYAAERARVQAAGVQTAHEWGVIDSGRKGIGRTTAGGYSDISNGVVRPERTITGYVCACPTPDAPTRPAVVLDPFCGTGTTAAVAHHLGRHGIGVDLSRDYLRLAEWRCGHDTRLRNKVLDRTGIPNPKPPAINGQLDLLTEWTA